MGTEDKKEDQEEELIPVGEGVEDPQPEQEEKREEKEEKELEDEEEEEERLGADEENLDDDEKKLKQRTASKARRERKKAAKERNEKEIAFLTQRNEQLERRFSEVEQRLTGTEVSVVDQKMAKVKSELKLADQVISKAITSGDGATYTEAQGIRDGLRDELTRLTYAKTTATQQPTRDAPNPVLVQHAQRFVADHEWWDPNGGDEDSRRVSQIDAQLVREGYDPNAPGYWTELADRVAEALPHRSEEGEESRKKRSTKKSKGPTFSTGGRERSLKKNEVYISAERKAAMEEAGVWDDPELRQKYLKSYATYDREAKA